VYEGLSIKDVRNQGGCPLRTRGILNVRTSALLMHKKLGFFEIYGVSARTGREESILDFVRTHFMDGP